MHAFLIISQNKTLTEQKTQDLLDQYKLVRRDWELTKISDVRELEKFTKLSLNTPTAIVIQNFENASIAAQNSFLKNLEEPQPNLKYIICSQTSGSILPTIHSRCEIIEIKTNKTHSADLLKTAEEFITGDYEARYKLITKMNKREDALQFVEALLSVTREKMKQGKISSDFVAKTQFCLYALQRNGNVGLQLTNLATA